MKSLEKFVENKIIPDVLSTFCALCDTQRKVGEHLNYIKSKRARDYFLYGLSRRLQIIINNVNFFKNTIQQNRKKPLNVDEACNASIHLNSLYVHLYGAIDNIAWIFVYEKSIYGEGNIEQTSLKREVGLFKHRFLKKIGGISPILNEYKEYLETKEDWYREMSELRAPSTHRMPLYVIPSVLNESEQYFSLQNSYKNAAMKLNFDEARKHFNELQSLGEFVPFFAHDPNEKPLPIYEIITKDCDHLVQILNKTYSVIEAMYTDYCGYSN